ASLGRTFVNVRVELVAVGLSITSTYAPEPGELSFCHWNVSGALPEAEALNDSVVHSFRLVLVGGCCVMDGAMPGNEIATLSSCRAPSVEPSLLSSDQRI